MISIFQKLVWEFSKNGISTLDVDINDASSVLAFELFEFFLPKIAVDFPWSTSQIKVILTILLYIQ